MAVIKCKMCGGDLNLIEGSTVCECEYCGTKQTVPSADNEKKLTLFNRAGRLLRACEFDKAAGVFETIVADFPQEAEAYWGLVLCKYGIEYVDDPATGKKIPTCHRSSFDNVMKDPNFEQACENTDAVARRVYRDEARAIEELRKNIIEVSDKEEPYDVFISYKETDANGERTPDSELAQKIYRELSREGYRVFFSRISLESHLGTEYEPYIFAALNSAKVMLVVGTDYENFDAVWVKNEWSRFLKLIAKGEKKTLIPVYKDMDAYDMPEEFSKLTALDMGRIAAMEDLIHGVEKLVGKKKAEPVQAQPVQQVVQQTVVQGGGPNVLALLKRGQQALEDGDWTKAKGFYDQVLSMDAENADAFIGLALAGQQSRDLKAYIDSLCSGRVNVETDTLGCDKALIESSIAKSVVPGYCDGKEIKKLYDFAVAYPVKLREENAVTQQIKSRFSGDRNLNRAFRYAQGETKQKLDTLKKELFDTLDKRIHAAEASDKKALEEARAEFAAKLEAADQKAAEMSRAAQEKRETDYQAACSLQARAEYGRDYARARESFSKIGEYKDAKNRAVECEKEYARIEEARQQEKQTAYVRAQANKKKHTILGLAVAAFCLVALIIIFTVVVPSIRYNKAISLSEEGNYKEAIELLQKLGSYKGSEELLLTTEKLYYLQILPTVSVGDYIEFGRYNLDNNTKNGQDTIGWMVLEKEDDRVLVICDLVLEYMPYNDVNENVTWETCSLRRWLNNDFLQEAFDATELQMIEEHTVKPHEGKNSSVDYGRETQDRVFLLDWQEFYQYFDSNAERQFWQGKCWASAHVQEGDHFSGLKKSSLSTFNSIRSNCPWWLRSPGQDQNRADNYSGFSFGVGTQEVNYQSGVRPAMWIVFG